MVISATLPAVEDGRKLIFLLRLFSYFAARSESAPLQVTTSEEGLPSRRL